MFALIFPIMFCSYFLVTAGSIFSFLDSRSRPLLFIAPILGGSISGIVIYNALIISQGDLKAAGIAMITLLFVGVAGWRKYIKNTALFSEQYSGIERNDLTHILVLVAFCALPMVQHVVPPDVDAQYSTTLAAYLLIGDNYPFLSLVGQKSHEVLLPDTFGLTLAVSSQLWPELLTQASIGLASAWSALALIALLPIAQRLLGNERVNWLSVSLVIACGYSAAFLWNFGDGSYIRTSAIAVFVAIPILWMMLDEGKYKAFIIITPFLFASVFYSHQRYAILLTTYMLVLGLLFVLTRGPGQRLSSVKALLAYGALSALLLLPLFSKFLVFASLNEGTPIGNVELKRTVVEVYQNFIFRFHSEISWAATIFGIVVSLRQLRNNVIFLAATVQILVYFYFTTPPLVTNITPILAPLAYARVVALDPVVFGKFCFVSIFLITVSRSIHRLSLNEGKNFGYVVIAVIIISASSVVFIHDTNLYSVSGHFRNQITNFLPTPFLTHWLSFAALLFSAVFLVWLWWRNRHRGFVNVSFLSLLPMLLAVFWALDIVRGKINYPYHSKSISHLAEWLRNNTVADSAVLFKGCNLDPFGTDIRLTRPVGAQEKVMYQWELDWLPALSGRRSICNRLHLVGYKSRIVSPELSQTDEFYQAHKLLYGAEDVKPGNHFAALGITHVIASFKTKIMRDMLSYQSPYLRKIYQQEGRPGYAVYEVVSD